MRTQVKVDLRELVEHLKQQPRIVQALQLVGEQELFEEDVAGVGRKLGDVVDQILMDVLGVLTLERGEGELAGVVDLHTLADASEQNRVASSIVHLFGESLGRDFALSRTAGFVGSRMQSRRRKTTNGRITLPYSDCLKSPLSNSAIDQTNDPKVLISLAAMRPLGWFLRR